MLRSHQYVLYRSREWTRTCSRWLDAHCRTAGTKQNLSASLEEQLSAGVQGKLGIVRFCCIVCRRPESNYHSASTAQSGTLIHCNGRGPANGWPGWDDPTCIHDARSDPGVPELSPLLPCAKFEPELCQLPAPACHHVAGSDPVQHCCSPGLSAQKNKLKPTCFRK